jgi:hypothetical protein
MTLGRLTWETLPLRIHVPAETELASPLSATCAEFYLSKMHATQLLVHKTLSCFTICVVEFLNYRCGIWMQIQQFCYILRWCAGTPVYCASWADHLVRGLKSITSLVQFCSFSRCLPRIPLLSRTLPATRNLSHNTKLMPSFEQPHEEISDEFTTSLFAWLLFGIRIIKKHDMFQWNRHSECRCFTEISEPSR